MLHKQSAGCRSRDAGWTARWIWCADSVPNQWVCFRRCIELEPDEAGAVLRLAADSKYWLWVNGELVIREGSLKRGPTPTGAYFDEVDIRPWLREGRNALAVLVWHFGKDGASHRDSGHGGLLIEPDRDTLAAVRTDSRWRARVHPSFADTGDGWSVTLSEKAIHFDARVDMPGWTSVEFDDQDWPAATAFASPPAPPWGELRPRPIPFWRDSDELNFVRTDKQPIDSGQCAIRGWLDANRQVLPVIEIANAAGGERITIKIERDLKTTQYTCHAGPQRFEVPAWGNGHYVDFSFPDHLQVGVRYRETRFDVDDERHVRADDPAMDALLAKSVRSVVVNARDNYMDCPDRERSAWPGDIASMIEPAMYGLSRSIDLLTRKTLLEFLDWRTEEGVLWGAVPTGRFRGTFRSFPSQTLALIAVGIPEYVWFSGDLELARRAIDPLSRYLFDLWSINSAGLPQFAFPIGPDWDAGHRDWRDWGVLPIDAPPLDAAWYAAALNGLRRVAEAVDDLCTVERCSRIHDQVAASFHRVYWSEAHQAYRSDKYGPDLVDDRGNALAVYARIARSESHAPIARLLARTERASIYLEKYAIEALCMLGRLDLASDRIRRRYQAAIHSSYSTLPENFGEESNHGWGGVPVVFVVKHLLGFEPVTPGCERVRVNPRWAGFGYRGTLRLPSGQLGFEVGPPISDSRPSVRLEASDGVRIEA